MIVRGYSWVGALFTDEVNSLIKSLSRSCSEPRRSHGFVSYAARTIV
jgi:hypothetical protein